AVGPGRPGQQDPRRADRVAGAVEGVPRDAGRRRRDRHDPADPARLEPDRGLHRRLRGDVRAGPARVVAEDHLTGARPRRRRGHHDPVGPGPGRGRPGGDLPGHRERREARRPRLEPLDDLRQQRGAQPRRDRVLRAPRPQLTCGQVGALLFQPRSQRLGFKRHEVRRGRNGRLVPAVEEYGVEPIPADLRTTRWRDLFAINFTFFLNPVMYVVGAIAVAGFGLPLWWAVLAIVVGQALAYAVMIPIAEVGVDYGLPGQVAARATLGFWGARLLSSPYRVVAATYWFAAQAIAAGYAIQAVVQAMGGGKPPLVPVAIGVGALHATLAVLGFDVMRWLLRVVLPISLIFVGVIVSLYVSTDNPRFEVGRVFDSPDQHLTWVGFAGAVTLMAGSTLTLVTNVADFCRYTPTRRDVRIGLAGSAIAAVIVDTFVGGYAAAATGETNPFIAVADLTSSKALLAVLLVAIVVQGISANIGNVYTAGLSLVNSVPVLGRVRATLLVAAAAVGLSAAPDVIDSAQRWIVHLGNV